MPESDKIASYYGEYLGATEFIEDYVTRWRNDMKKVLAEYGIQDMVILDNLVEVAYHHVEKELLSLYKVRLLLNEWKEEDDA